MADTVLDSRPRMLGSTSARRVLTPAAGAPQVPGVQVHLVMTEGALADADDEPAHVVGVGPIPAPLVRDLVRADEKTGGVGAPVVHRCPGCRPSTSTFKWPGSGTSG